MTALSGSTNIEPRTIVERIQSLHDTTHAHDAKGHLRDMQGNDLGIVREVLVDQSERKVRFLLVEYRDRLGKGEAMSLIPVDAIARISPNGVYVNLSRDRVAAAPSCHDDLVNSGGYLWRICNYYGYPPYWLGQRPPVPSS